MSEQLNLFDKLELDPLKNGRLHFTYGSLIDLCKQQSEFMVACDQSIGEGKDISLWDSLIAEEIDEAGAEVVRDENYEEVVDINLPRYTAELADVVYVILGQVNNLGVQKQFQALFDAIHETNMTKVDKSTGKVLRREDGKILKPANFVPVDVETIFKDNS